MIAAVKALSLFLVSSTLEGGMRRFCLAVLVGVSLWQAAGAEPLVHDRHVVFENSAADGSYYSSQGTVICAERTRAGGEQVSGRRRQVRQPSELAPPEVEIGHRVAIGG